MKKFYIPFLAVALALTMAFFTSTVCAVANETNELSANLMTPAIKLLTPIGGEHLKVGDIFQIRWTPTNGRVRLYVYNSNVYGSGSTNYIQEELVDANTGHLDWVIDAKMLPVGRDLDGGSYQILLDDAEGNPLDSSYAFSIAR